MYQVDVHYGNTTITLDCDDPDRIKELASKVNKQIDILSQDRPHMSSGKLAFIVALLLQDELEQCYTAIKSLEQENDSLQQEVAQANQTLEQLALRVEDLAKRVGK